jgi:hypothetical protein
VQVVALFLGLLFAAAILLSTTSIWLFFVGLTAVFQKDNNWHRRLSSSALNALPFAFLALVTMPFLFAGAIASRSGVPGTNQLPNGYRLMIVSGRDPGWIYNPENENTAEGVNWKKDGLSGVVLIQVSGRYILGARTNRGPSGGANPVYPVDSYFLLDTETREIVALPSFQNLQTAAAQRGIRVKLQTFYEGYSSFGLMRVARLSNVALQLCLAIFVVLLAVWFSKLRSLRAVPVDVGNPT